MRRILIVILLIIGLDQLIGFVLSQLYLRTSSGDRGGDINGALRRNSDVLVLGSSRAKHHVIPAILRDKLSVSVFNAGIDGHDFLYAIMLLNLWTQSHPPPKAILLHVDPTSLAYSKQELDRASIFSGYFWESQRVRDVLLMRGKYEWVKYLSSSYRFNGKVLQVIKNLLAGDDDPPDGYVGLQGSIEGDSLGSADAHNTIAEFEAPFWDLKLNYLAELARYCRTNGTYLILFHSPRIREDSAALAAWSQRLSLLHQSYGGVEYLNLTEQTRQLFTERPDLYKDGAHLNAVGAKVFSMLLADEVASLLRVGSAKR
ncbi:MAG: hypothetical protein IPK92_10445 [Nitrospira sp.]|jgi:hypothetical protein|nr:hypothetical protein [Nitrospira sp.]MBL8052428.1 hypothetical protein [Nitrospira sp.]